MSGLLIPVYRYGVLEDYALIDVDDEPLVAPYKWLSLGGYAHAGARLNPAAPRIGNMAMHRLILGLSRNDGKFTHHVNEDRFDNRRENLQVFESAQEANLQPHPRRDLWHRHDLPRHFRERLIDEASAEVAA